MVAIMAGLGARFGGGWRVGVQLYMDLAGACISLSLCSVRVPPSPLATVRGSVSQGGGRKVDEEAKGNPVVRA